MGMAALCAAEADHHTNVRMAIVTCMMQSALQIAWQVVRARAQPACCTGASEADLVSPDLIRKPSLTLRNRVYNLA